MSRRHPLLDAVRQPAGRTIRDVADVEVDHQPQRPLPQRGLVAIGPGQCEQRGHQAGTGMPLGPDHDVLQRGQTGKQAEALQRTGDAEARQPVRPVAGQARAAPVQLTRLRPDETAHHVEQGRLSGAVRTDHARHATLRNAEGDAIKGDQPSETDRNVAKFEQHRRRTDHHSSSRSRHGHPRATPRHNPFH